MARIHFTFFALLIFTLTVFTIASCSDDTTSGMDEADIPSVPGFITAFMADEMFHENNDPNLNVRKSTSRENFLERVHTQVQSGKLSTGSVRQQQITISEENDDENGLTNFETAGELISEIRMSLQSVQFLYYQIFIPVVQRSPEVSDGVLVWEYQMPVTDSEMVLDARVTVDPINEEDEYIWTININGLYMDDPSIEVKALEAISSFDGTTGSLKANMPVLMGGEVFVSELSWSIEENMFLDMTFEFEFNDEEADQIRTGATYALDTELSDASITDGVAFVENEFDFQFDSRWNLESKIGDVTVNGEQLCWDEDHQDIACE